MTKSKNRKFAELARSSKLSELKDANIPAGLTISTYGASLIDDAHSTAARTTLGSVIGTDVQAHSSVLDSTTAAFTTALNTKLSGIETSATADQTAAEIRTLVEAGTDSNVFTDADHTKLNGIAASADVTSITVSDGTNSTARAAGSTITFSGTSNETTVAESSGTITIGLPNDVTVSNDLTVSGDLVVSGSTTQTGAIITDNNFTGLTNANTGNATDFGFYGKYVESSTTKYAGLYYDASTDNTFNLFCDTQTVPSSTVNTSATGYASANLAVNNLIVGGTVDGRDVAADGTKLDSIESGADVTDSANVTSAIGQNVGTTGDPSLKGLTLTDDGQSGSMLVIDADDASPWQIELTRAGAQSSKVFVNNTAWAFQHNPTYYNGGSYSRFLHTGDEGSGNGLDADTLDGNHASAFLTAHPNISAATGSNNSGNTFIQDIALDGNGHVTGIATATASGGGSGAGYIDTATGNYGTVKVDDDRGVSHAGYAIRDDWVFMSSGATYCGIYNDTDNQWQIYAERNGYTQLRYAGNTRIETTNAGATCTGTFSATQFTATSDLSKKENLEVVGDALSKVQTLTGYTYDMKEDGSRKAGLIAQDVEKVLPEAVSGEEGEKALDYSATIALLVNAVKEQQNQIEELKTLIRNN